MGYVTDAAKEFAERIKGLGFKVYLAKKGTYGFITDDSAARVLSFSLNDNGSLGGNYRPPSSESGTGWRLDKTLSDMRTVHDVREALYTHPPLFCGRGWKHLSTVAQYLAQYGSSSQFEEV